MMYATDFAVIDFEDSLCGDCAKIDTCLMIQKVEECYDAFWKIGIKVEECNRYLSNSRIKEEQNARASGAAQGK